MINHCEGVQGTSLEQAVGTAFSPGLFPEIQLALDTRGKAFRVRYPYGTKVVSQGRFQTPCEGLGTLGMCDECKELSSLVKDCGTPIPLMTILNDGHAEIYLDTVPPSDADSVSHSKVLRVVGRRELLGVFECLDDLFVRNPPLPTWNVAAGARSVAIPMRKKEDLLKFRLKGSDLVPRKDRRKIGLDDWELLKFAHQFAARIDVDPTEPLVTELLVLPIEWRQIKREKILGLTTELSQMAWIQSSHYRLRRNPLLQPAVHEFIRGKVGNPNFESEILFHVTLDVLIQIAHGNYPVLSPVSMEEQPRTIPLPAFQRMMTKVFSRAEAEGIPVFHPIHLLQTGDMGFFSIRFHGYSHLGHGKLKSYARFMDSLARFLDDAEYRRQLGIDHLSIEFVQSPLENEQAYAHQRHPFFVGRLKVVKQ